MRANITTNNNEDNFKLTDPTYSTHAYLHSALLILCIHWEWGNLYHANTHGNKNIMKYILFKNTGLV